MRTGGLCPPLRKHLKRKCHRRVSKKTAGERPITPAPPHGFAGGVMAVSTIQGYGADVYQAQQLLEKMYASGSAGDSGTTSSAVRTVSAVAELTRAVMEKMGVGENDRVSFEQISVYRRKLEEEYAEKLRADFAELGIDPDISFQLKENGEGGLIVGSTHVDKDKVQQYFDNNPDMVEKYTEIQTLADLEAARSRLNVNPAELKKRIQIENMSAWWAGRDEGASIMSLSSEGSSWFSGLNATA
jgi:hypothetical protein